MKSIVYLWVAAAVWGVLLSGIPHPAVAEDLAVDWVTATPDQGQAGDAVTLKGRIVNFGPGHNYALQYQWYLSADEEITTDDMALGSVGTLYNILYAGSGTTVTLAVTVPAFPDPISPSYFGLMIYYPLFPPFDDDPNNNTGSAAFTFTTDPPHGFYDTVGDNYLDAVHLSAVVTGGNLKVAVTFSRPPASTISLLMGIDLDQDPSTTGPNTTLAGTEAMVSLVYEKLTAESVVNLVNDDGSYTLADALLAGNTLTYFIPPALLGNDPAMDLFWAIDHAVGPTADFDRAPDVGAFSTDTEAVGVRRPGDATIQAVVADQSPDPGEADFPDIQQLEARVVGDQLQLTLTYAHSVDVTNLPLGSDGLFVWIDMDIDRRLATGFANSGQTPPTMGIDHQLRLQIDALAGIIPELWKDVDGDGEPEVSPMGLPFNDMFMGLADNRIILRIPLSYLGNTDGSGAMAVTSLNTREILTGVIDRLPDSGTWDLKTDAPLPKQTCRAPSREVDDPADDSLGAFGYDNDELVHASICLGDQALLFAIDYEKYLLSNDGATLIFLDTDRSSATGWPITNLAGDTTIGAEYVLRSYWDYIDLKQTTHLNRTLAPETVQTAYQFATPTQANRLYLTLPLESIGFPTGPVDILIKSASWGDGGGILLPNDDLPNSGVITLATIPDVLAGDLDFDGDVDGRDLAILVNNPALIGLDDFALDFGRLEARITNLLQYDHKPAGDPK